MKLQRGAESAMLSAKWIHQDGRVLARRSQTTRIAGLEVIELHVSDLRHWPTGDYEVVISLDGRKSIGKALPSLPIDK